MESKIRIAGVLIEKQGKILFNKRKFPPGIGKLDFVGGYVDKNETPEEAAIREAKEESGYIVELIEKIYQGIYFERKEKEMYLFRAKIIAGAEGESIEGQPIWKTKEELSADDFAFAYIYTLLKKIWQKEIKSY